MSIAKINNTVTYTLSRPVHYPFYTIWGGITLPDDILDPPVFRNFYTLIYVYKGEGAIYQHDNKIIATAGDFFLLSPGYTYSFERDGSKPWKEIWCAVSNTHFLSGLMSAYNIENVKRFHKINTPLQLENIVEILQAQDNSKEAFRKLETMLFETICALSDFSASNSQAISIAEMGKSYIDTNGLNMSINDICDQLSVSTSHFFRLFTKEFGISPKNYIMNKKLDIAMDSLLYTNLSIGEIAELLGYENIGSFSSVFHKKTGLTPLEYRKQFLDVPQDKRKPKNIP